MLVRVRLVRLRSGRVVPGQVGEVAARRIGSEGRPEVTGRWIARGDSRRRRRRRIGIACGQRKENATAIRSLVQLAVLVRADHVHDVRVPLRRIDVRVVPALAGARVEGRTIRVRRGARCIRRFLGPARPGVRTRRARHRIPLGRKQCRGRQGVGAIRAPHVRRRCSRLTVDRVDARAGGCGPRRDGREVELRPVGVEGRRCCSEDLLERRRPVDRRTVPPDSELECGRVDASRIGRIETCIGNAADGGCADVPREVEGRAAVRRLEESERGLVGPVLATERRGGLRARAGARERAAGDRRVAADPAGDAGVQVVRLSRHDDHLGDRSRRE